MKQHLPNGLTFSRGLLTLAMIVLFFVELPSKFLIILLLLFLASATDYLDGYLARKWGVISEFGIVFDSLFDKILTISLLVLLVPYEVLQLAMIVGFIVRDIFVDGIKNYSLKQGYPVPSISSAKWKFACQVVMLHAAVAYLAFPQAEWLKLTAQAVGLLGLLFAYWSAALYTARFAVQQRR